MIYTVGYERLKLSDFIEALCLEEIELLIDVRELPLSRKTGFSKRSLREALQEVGIEYQHEKPLGAPKHIREELKRTRDWEKYKSSYHYVLLKQSSSLEHIAQAASQKRVCLMCFEEDHRFCHRSLITERLQELKYTFSVSHLHPQAERVEVALRAK